jgi:hypothetical protein
MADVELVLEPLEDEVVKAAQTNTALLKSAFGKRNRIMVGRPASSELGPDEFGYSVEVVEKERLRGFELVRIVTNASFVPDFGCKFVAADLSFAFSTTLEGGKPRAAPIVCELRPREVVRENTYREEHKTGAKVSGTLTAGFTKLLSELSDSNTFKVGGKMMVRDVYGYGLNFPEAGWRLQASLGHELAGIYEGLTFVVKKPTGAPLFAELKVGAEIAVEGAVDRWATLAFGLSRNSNALDRIFDLSAS